VASYVPHTDAEIAEMLSFLGLSGIEELFAAIPAAIRLGRGLDLADGISEPDLLARFTALAERNGPSGDELICFAGGGAYDRELPAAVRALAGRSEFMTAYTPYQPEVAQGVLQAVFEYQTMVTRLTGLEISNSSLYDGANALVEAVNLSVAATGCNRVLVSQGIHPNWRQVLTTLGRGSGRAIETVRLAGGSTDWASLADEGPGSAGAVVVAYPNHLGLLEDLGSARELADRTGALFVVCFDPVAAGVLASPASAGADVAVGEGQALGTPLSYGGPYLGIFTCRASHVRRLPGRLVGETVDVEGRRAYVTTLRSREQDIRRAKATSNVCTDQTLMAVTAAIHLGWLGSAGLREVALRSARGARYCREALLSNGSAQLVADAPTLYEFAVRAGVPGEVLVERLAEDGFLAGLPIGLGMEGSGAEEALLVAVTERRTRSEIDAFVAAFEKAAR
jgi:glycine dehydrogenase subunit 1